MGGGRFFGVLCPLMLLGASAFGQTNLLDADPDSPTFNNPSFERPDTTFVTIVAEKWTLTGPRTLQEIPPFGIVPVVAGTGVFENPTTIPGGRITNADGTQIAYIFANSFPDVITTVHMDHAFTQILPRTLSAGEVYELAVGVAHAQAQPPPESTLTLSLFAFDSDSSAETLLGFTNLSNTGAINGLTLTDFYVHTPPISGAAIGDQLGIRISTHTDPTVPSATGQFDFDNVRVYVPEPGSAALLAVAAVFGLGVRRRQQ